MMERGRETRHLPQDRRKVEEIPRTKVPKERKTRNRGNITTNHQKQGTRRFETKIWSP